MMARKGFARFRHDERGNAAVELALILPVLAIITFGAIDLARLFYAYMTVASAAHEAAAYAALNRGDATAQQPATLMTVATSESGGYLTSTNTTLTFTQAAVTSNTGAGDMKKVQLTYGFRPLMPIPLPGPIPVTAVAAAR